MATQPESSPSSSRISINPPVFYGSAGLLLVLVGLTSVFQQQA